MNPPVLYIIVPCYNEEAVLPLTAPLFLEKILKELDRYCMVSIRPTVDVKLAALGDDSILYGDLALIKGL